MRIAGLAETLAGAGAGEGTPAGKTVIDCGNAVDVRDFSRITFDGRSGAEEAARPTPGAHLVKAFNQAEASVWRLDPPEFDGRRLAVPYGCGGHWRIELRRRHAPPLLVELIRRPARPHRIRPANRGRPAASRGKAVAGRGALCQSWPMSDTEPEPSAAAPAPEPAEDDVKRKFREALERKQAHHSERNGQTAAGGGKAHGAHGPVAGRRTFRRKAG